MTTEIGNCSTFVCIIAKNVVGVSFIVVCYYIQIIASLRLTSISVNFKQLAFFSTLWRAWSLISAYSPPTHSSFSLYLLLLYLPCIHPVIFPLTANDFNLCFFFLLLRLNIRLNSNLYEYSVFISVCLYIHSHTTIWVCISRWSDLFS